MHATGTATEAVAAAVIVLVFADVTGAVSALAQALVSAVVLVHVFCSLSRAVRVPRATVVVMHAVNESVSVSVSESGSGSASDGMNDASA